MEQLAPRFRVLAPDLYGAGGSPSWPLTRAIRLRDEAVFIEPVLASASAPMLGPGATFHFIDAWRAEALKAVRDKKFERVS